MVLVHPSFFGGGFYDNLSENYDFILTDPSSAAGLYIGNVGSGSNSPTQVQFLSSNGDVIAEEIFTINNLNLIGTDFDNRVFYGITSSEAIAIIRTIEPAIDRPEFPTKSAIAKHSSLTGSGFEQSDRRFPQPTVCCQILS